MPPKKIANEVREKAESLLKNCTGNCCDVCATLFDSETPACAVVKCLHIFCTLCMDQWTLQSNRCPMCRQKFNSTLFLSPDGISERKYKRPRSQQDSSDDEDRDPVTLTCRICFGSNDVVSMVMCNSRSCDYVAHESCLTGRGIRIDGDRFLCSDCTQPQSLSVPQEGDTPQEISTPLTHSTPTTPLPPVGTQIPQGFTPRVIRRPTFEAPPEPYYLGEETADHVNGLSELRRRRETVPSRKPAHSSVPFRTAPVLDREALFRRVFESTLTSILANERKNMLSLNEFGAFSSIPTPSQQRAANQLELSARKRATEAAHRVLASKESVQCYSNSIEENRRAFIEEKRELAALQKLRALIAENRRRSTHL